MARFERLLIPIIAVVMVAAFLLEGAGAPAVRGIALGLGMLLVVAILVGMYHRVRRKRQPGGPPADQNQTSNDPGGSASG